MNSDILLFPTTHLDEEPSTPNYGDWGTNWSSDLRYALSRIQVPLKYMYFGVKKTIAGVNAAALFEEILTRRGLPVIVVPFNTHFTQYRLNWDDGLLFELCTSTLQVLRPLATNPRMEFEYFYVSGTSISEDDSLTAEYAERIMETIESIQPIPEAMKTLEDLLKDLQWVLSS